MNITIRQRENGKYQAIVSYKDVKQKWKQKSKGGFDKYKDAKKWANDTSFELQNLEKKGILSNNYTLKEVFDLYLEVNAQNQAPRTAELYKRTLVFFEQYAEVEVKSIKSIDLLNFIKKKRLLTGNKYNNYISKLKTVFNFAVKEIHACEFNPCNLLYKDNRDTDSRIKFIDKDLYLEIIDNMNKEKEKLLIRVLYETGMRIGEALGISTQYVNKCLIDVRQQFNIGSNCVTKQLKSKNSYRTIPISRELYVELKKATCDINGRIFYDIKYKTLMKKLKEFNVSCHCFRHTRATILVSSGIDLTVISSIIGDKIETVLNTYVEINRNNIEDKYEKVRQLI